MPVFGPDSPVLLPAHVGYAGAQRWFLWPTLRYRVVSPMMRDPGLNIFQTAVLGLARSGLREVSDIAELLKLEPALVGLVVSDLEAYRYLDRYGAVTEAGRAALRDGFVDPASNVVTYVFQDVFTGTLLPFTVAHPAWVRSAWRNTRNVQLNFGTTGSPLRKTAFAVDPGDVEAVEPPLAEQILETVARSGDPRRDGGRRRRRPAAVLPDRIVSRVSAIGRGDPTYVPLVVRLDKRRDEDADAVSWSAYNTMNGQPSNYLRRLIATRAQHSEPLRERIQNFVGQQSDALLRDYDRLDVELRRQFTETLEARFTVRVREHRELVELLSLLKRDMERTRLQGDHRTEVSSAVHRAWQVHEFVLREVVRRHPVPPSCMKDRSDPLTGFLGECCRRLEMPFSEQAAIRVVKSSQLRGSIARRRANTPVLLALCLLSAVHGDAEHPFRRLAGVRPRLLSELTALSGDRNDSAHSGPVNLNQEFAESAWRLTQDTVTAFLGLPFHTSTDKEPIVVP